VTPIRIGYNKLWGAVMLLVAALGIVVYAMTGAFIQLGLGLVFAIAGVLWLTRPFLVVTDGQIAVKNLMGLTLRRFPFPQLADLEVHDGAIMLGSGKDRMRLKLSTMVVSRSDLDRLGSAVAEARAARAAAAPASPAPDAT
jgi:hypothetical protein